MTSAERAAGRAPITPVARPARPRPRDFSALDLSTVGLNSSPGLRTGTGLALLAGGAILLLAVHVRTSFLNLQTAGLILLLTGLSWLWIPVRDKRRLLRRALAGVRRYLERDADLVGGVRRPLAELFAPETDRDADPATKVPPAADH